MDFFYIKFNLYSCYTTFYKNEINTLCRSDHHYVLSKQTIDNRLSNERV